MSLKEYMKVIEKPKRKQGAFDFKNEALGIDGDDLDKPTHLRRQAASLSVTLTEVSLVHLV